MKRFFLLLCLVIPGVIFAQFPNNPRKIRLGYQTDANYLFYLKDGAPSHTPSDRFDSFLTFDTTNNVLYYYDLTGASWVPFSTRDTVFTIASVPDTTTLSPLQGDIFINDSNDTLGVYSGSDGWFQLFGQDGDGIYSGSGTVPAGIIHSDVDYTGVSFYSLGEKDGTFAIADTLTRGFYINPSLSSVAMNNYDAATRYVNNISVGETGLTLLSFEQDGSNQIQFNMTPDSANLTGLSTATQSYFLGIDNTSGRLYKSAVSGTGGIYGGSGSLPGNVTVTGGSNNFTLSNPNYFDIILNSYNGEFYTDIDEHWWYGTNSGSYSFGLTGASDNGRINISVDNSSSNGGYFVFQSFQDYGFTPDYYTELIQGQSSTDTSRINLYLITDEAKGETAPVFSISRGTSTTLASQYEYLRIPFSNNFQDISLFDGQYKLPNATPGNDEVLVWQSDGSAAFSAASGIGNDNLGNHTATTTLDLANNNIDLGTGYLSPDGTNIGISLTASGGVVMSDTLKVGGNINIGANYISNDGDDEGISIASNGSTTIISSVGAALNVNTADASLQDARIYINSDGDRAGINMVVEDGIGADDYMVQTLQGDNGIFTYSVYDNSLTRFNQIFNYDYVNRQMEYASYVNHGYNTTTPSEMIDVVGNIELNGDLIYGASGPIITSGSGSPEGSVTADVGSYYINTTGAAGTAGYLKESGTGNTGWSPILAHTASSTIDMANNNIDLGTGYLSPDGTNIGISLTASGGVILSDTLLLGGNVNTNGNWISGDGDDEGIYVDAIGNVGIGVDTVSIQGLHIKGGSNPSLMIEETSGSDYFLIEQWTPTATGLKHVNPSGNSIIEFDPIVSDGTSSGFFRFFRRTNTTGPVSFTVFQGDNTSTAEHYIYGNGDSYFAVNNDMAVGYGVGTTLYAKLHVNGDIGVGGVSPPTITSGSGSPEGAVTADVGSYYMNTTGAAGTAGYLKESGTGNTGWSPILAHTASEDLVMGSNEINIDGWINSDGVDNEGLNFNANNSAFFVSDSNGADFEVQTSSTNTAIVSSIWRTKSSGDMTDNFGSGFRFDIEDDAATSNAIMWLYARRDGADNSGKFQLLLRESGTARYYLHGKSDGSWGLDEGGFSSFAPTALWDLNGDTGYNQLRLRTSFTPTGTADSSGNQGDIAWDDSYIYVKTSSGWERAALSTF